MEFVLAHAIGTPAEGFKCGSEATLRTTLEPDLLFLSRQADGRFVLRAGVLCFPIGWALEERIGQLLDVIHGVVPGLNRELGESANQFLSRFRAGFAFMRDQLGNQFITWAKPTSLPRWSGAYAAV